MREPPEQTEQAIHRAAHLGIVELDAGGGGHLEPAERLAGLTVRGFIRAPFVAGFSALTFGEIAAGIFRRSRELIGDVRIVHAQLRDHRLELTNDLDGHFKGNELHGTSPFCGSNTTRTPSAPPALRALARGYGRALFARPRARAQKP